VYICGVTKTKEMKYTTQQLTDLGFERTDSFQYSKKLNDEWHIVCPIYNKAGRTIVFHVLVIDGDTWCYIDSIEEMEALAKGDIDPQNYYDENE